MNWWLTVILHVYCFWNGFFFMWRLSCFVHIREQLEDFFHCVLSIRGSVFRGKSGIFKWQRIPQISFVVLLTPRFSANSWKIYLSQVILCDRWTGCNHVWMVRLIQLNCVCRKDLTATAQTVFVRFKYSDSGRQKKKKSDKFFEHSSKDIP